RSLCAIHLRGLFADPARPRPHTLAGLRTHLGEHSASAGLGVPEVLTATPSLSFRGDASQASLRSQRKLVCACQARNDERLGISYPDDTGPVLAYSDRPFSFERPNVVAENSGHSGIAAHRLA